MINATVTLAPSPSGSHLDLCVVSTEHDDDGGYVDTRAVHLVAVARSDTDAVKRIIDRSISLAQTIGAPLRDAPFGTEWTPEALDALISQEANA